MDIKRKYEFLRMHEPMGILRARTDRAMKLDNARSRRLLSVVRSYRKINEARILDVGGGDGRLLRPFLKHTKHCFVVDFNDRPVEGVTRLGNEIDEIHGQSFDVIICSHVIEHVAQPRTMLANLKSLLAVGGILYVEVPFELWRDAPVQYDPVTHINFFTKQSMRTALHGAGLNVSRIQYDILPYGQRYKRSIWAIATPDGSRQVMDPREALGLINPGSIKRFVHRLQTMWIQRILNGERRF